MSSLSSRHQIAPHFRLLYGKNVLRARSATQDTTISLCIALTNTRIISRDNTRIACELVKTLIPSYSYMIFPRGSGRESGMYKYEVLSKLRIL